MTIRFFPCRHPERRRADERLLLPNATRAAVEGYGPTKQSRRRASKNSQSKETPPADRPCGEKGTPTAVDFGIFLTCQQGIVKRWPDGIPAAVRVQIERELALIKELKYEHFFLTVADIVDFARGRGILCQGRGSAANSAVCYALQVTEVDPARVSMLFERFISKERHEAPDIDVDFEHQRREEVIQRIYEKYGRHRAALAATLVTYRRRMAVRDVAKALGYPADVVDALAKSLHWFDGGGEVSAHLRLEGSPKIFGRDIGILPAGDLGSRLDDCHAAAGP